MSAQCKHCGSIEIDHDPSRGDAVCMLCGSVLEESIIVSEVQYALDCSGATRAIGQLVSAEGSIPSGFNLGHGYGLGKESRAITLQNAKKKISNLASHLKLPERCVDIAHNFYKMALMRKLTQGRKNPHVIAACVYMVCRKEETPHMLLDLSDILQVNVYDLGKTYLKLSTALCINTPAIDPSLYILRFAHQLDFGDKTHEVSVTASRLVQRMKRDWMHTGRRPSGLCGAALLVAARLHNFSRSVDDIIKVVKVCQATVRKRLTEFSDTPSSHLTLDEFMTIDLEEEQDPPAFKAARKKKLMELEGEVRGDEATKQISDFQDIIDKALEEARQKKFARFAKYSQEGTTPNPAENLVAQQFIVEESMKTINNVLSTGEVEASSKPTPVLQKLLSPAANSFSDSGIGSESNLSCVSVETDKESVISIQTVEDASEEFQSLDLTGLDDDEINSYIMDEEETKSKTEFWFKTNEDYLLELKEKEEKRQVEAENASKEQKKKRKRSKAKIQANSTEEAIEKMMQQRKISLKLDYHVLQNLNSEKPVEDDKDVIVFRPEPESSEAEPNPPKRFKSTTPNLPSVIRKGISTILDTVGNATSKLTSTIKEPEPQVINTSLTKTAPATLPSEPETIVEEEYEEDEYDEEEEEEEPENNLSALLNKLRGEDGDPEYASCDYDRYVDYD